MPRLTAGIVVGGLIVMAAGAYVALQTNVGPTPAAQVAASGDGPVRTR